MIQGTRPQTPTFALTDSPLGLAAWIIEKFYEWSDCGGDIETRFSKDELLTNVMIYWLTRSIGTAFQPDRDYMKAGPARWAVEARERLVGLEGYSYRPRDVSKRYQNTSKRMGC